LGGNWAENYFDWAEKVGSPDSITSFRNFRQKADFGWHP